MYAVVLESQYSVKVLYKGSAIGCEFFVTNHPEQCGSDVFIQEIENV